MRPKTIALLIVLTLMVAPVGVLADVPYDNGPWSAIDSGYAVTTNHHGEDVLIPPDPPLVAQVGLLAVHFPYLEYVRVDLRDEDENVVDSAYLYPGDFIAGEFSPHGEPIMYALTKETGTDNEVLAPDTWEAPMHYSVKAYFFMDEEYGKPNPLVAEAMRAVTVMTIPEVPLGTLTVLLTMLATLGFLARKKL